MKKIVVFFIFIIICVALVAYFYINYTTNKKKIEQDNYFYESYYNKQIYGADVATIINTAMYSNRKNNIEKEKNGKYNDNEENTINIDLKMLDDDKIYNMEKIYNNNSMTFVEYYRNIKFKMTKIEYHKKTGLVKYMLIEQITK